MNLIKKAFLSKQNLNFVYDNLSYEIKHRFGLLLNDLYLNYTRKVLNHVFFFYKEKLTERFLSQPKNTIILLNAIAIKRLTNDIVKKKATTKFENFNDFKKSYMAKGGIRIDYLETKCAIPISEILKDGLCLCESLREGEGEDDDESPWDKIIVPEYIIPTIAPEIPQIIITPPEIEEGSNEGSNEINGEMVREIVAPKRRAMQSKYRPVKI